MSDYNEKEGWVCLTPEPLPLGTHIGYESIGDEFRIYVKRGPVLHVEDQGAWTIARSSGVIEGTFPVVADDFARADPKDALGGGLDR